MDDVGVSKLVSFVLRHDPGSVGLVLHSGGWIPVDTLVKALITNGHALDRKQLERVVRMSDKQRFAIDPRTDRIRANQGHSINIDLRLPAATPPDRLFHGTPRRNVASIEYQGLDHRHRLAVHLSTDEQTARQVGARRGDPVVLAVDAGRMHRDGHQFSVSANGVWLVLHVPPEYIERLPGDDISTSGAAGDEHWPYLGEPDDDENPWRDLRVANDEQRQSARYFAWELRKNLRPGHPLYGLEFEVMAQFLPRDEILVRLADERWAVVSLPLIEPDTTLEDPTVEIWTGREEIQHGIDAFLNT